MTEQNGAGRSATDRLRAMLDEREVEWHEPTMKPNTTWFPDAYGTNCRVKPWGDALCVKRYNLTPEQAIAATLGRGTCQIETTENWLPAERYHRCKECGAFFAVLDASHDIPPRCCPNCGRRIEGVSE